MEINEKKRAMKIIFHLTFCLFVLLTSCKTKEEKTDLYTLQPSNEYLTYEIDSDTEIPRYNLYTFEDKGTEYLTFSNPYTRIILVYELESGKFIKKIKFDVEGPNGIGNWLFGYLIKDFNHIYLPSANREELFLTDTTAVLKRKYDYSKTHDGKTTVKAYYTNMDYTQLIFIGDSLFIPQMLNNSLGDRMVEESVTGVYLDTMTLKVSQFPMTYPNLLSTEKARNVIYGTPAYSQICNGEDFIYSFSMDEKIYKVNPYTAHVETYPVKSRNLSRLKFYRIPNDFTSVLKKTCETARYGHILYDKYRRVYYRFVYPETELEDNLNYLSILHSGKKEFSIMILDEAFNVLGETKFPSFSYVPHIGFINEDGLYLSVSHFMRDDYSDDWLRFERIDLIRNE